MNTNLPFQQMKCAKSHGAGMLYSPDSDIIERIENWSRVYRTGQIIHAVPYYQPPEAGDVMEEERIVRLPFYLQDAIHLELVWRNMDVLGHKFYIKWQYINRLPCSPIWRKMKQYGVRIKNHTDHQLYDRSAVSYFERRL